MPSHSNMASLNNRLLGNLLALQIRATACEANESSLPNQFHFFVFHWNVLTGCNVTLLCSMMTFWSKFLSDEPTVSIWSLLLMLFCCFESEIWCNRMAYFQIPIQNGKHSKSIAMWDTLMVSGHCFEYYSIYYTSSSTDVVLSAVDSKLVCMAVILVW